jgi:hypothetical protein
MGKLLRVVAVVGAGVGAVLAFLKVRRSKQDEPASDQPPASTPPPGSSEPPEA